MVVKCHITMQCREIIDGLEKITILLKMHEYLSHNEWLFKTPVSKFTTLNAIGISHLIKKSWNINLHDVCIYSVIQFPNMYTRAIQIGDGNVRASVFYAMNYHKMVDLHINILENLYKALGITIIMM